MPPPIDHTMPPATMGEPLAAGAEAVQVAVGGLDVTVTAWTPLLQGTNRVPLRSADPPSEKQKSAADATWWPTPPRSDWFST